MDIGFGVQPIPVVPEVSVVFVLRDSCLLTEVSASAAENSVRGVFFGLAGRRALVKASL